jgi:large conductance mechanosensitive channel
MKIFHEFRQFAVRGNIIDMAVAFTVGVAFTGLARSLVDDILMPPIGLMIGDIDFSNKAVTLRDAWTGPDGAEHAAVLLRYGAFINSLVTFLIIALAIFLLIKIIKRLQGEPVPPPPAAPPRQEQLLTEIRDLLKRRVEGDDQQPQP